jgi:hypothetical protein
LTTIGEYKKEFSLKPHHEKFELPKGFVIEAWGQACQFLIAADAVLGEEGALRVAHLRAYLGKFLLTGSTPEGRKYVVNTYPVITAYITGVLIVELRVIGPPSSVALKDFIDRAVNLCNIRFAKILTSQGFSSYATRAYYAITTKPNFFGRMRLVWMQSGHDLAIEQQSEVQKDEAFSFELAPLSIARGEVLRDLAKTIFTVASFILSERSSALSFVIRGRKPLLNLGQYWSGRPYVYLIRFEDQGATASSNQIQHAEDFGRILARTVAIDEKRAATVLPNDLRLFEDYSAFLNRAVVLFVWPLQGLEERGEKPDLNHGDLIYQRQVVGETLEYGYMLYRSFYHRAGSLSRSSETSRVRRDALNLRIKMDEATHAGELRDLLKEGWARFGLPELILDTKEALSLQDEFNRNKQSVRTARIGWSLTSIFGFLAIPELAEKVIEPLWRLHPLYMSSDPTMVKLAAYAISVVLVLGVVGLTFVLVSGE